MSSRRLNSTGRRKILRRDIRTILTRSGGGLSFVTECELGGYGLPGDAVVAVEAHRQASFMRFEYGTVQRLGPLSTSPLRLGEFASPEGLLFRVKVASVGGHPGMLLAEGDCVPVVQDEGLEESRRRIPLLPPKPQDLGQEVWRIDFSGDGPLLLVNSRLDNWNDTARSPAFRGLVYPAALREVLTKVVLVEELPDEDEDGDTWSVRWMRFARSLGAGDVPADDEDREGWIQGVVEAFCRKHKFLSMYQGSGAGEGS
jgi:hypothetical protein